MSQDFALNGLYPWLINCWPKKSFSNYKDLLLIDYICLQCREISCYLSSTPSYMSDKTNIWVKYLLEFRCLHEDINSEQVYSEPTGIFRPKTFFPKGFLNFQWTMSIDLTLNLWKWVSVKLNLRPKSTSL